MLKFRGISKTRFYGPAFSQNNILTDMWMKTSPLQARLRLCSTETFSEDHDAGHADIRSKILENACQHVGIYGFTHKCLQDSAEKLGYSKSISAGAFPRGSIELVEFVVKKQNNELKERLSTLSTEE